MPILDMSLLKDFRCVLTVPKGGLVRHQQEDGFWSIVRSPERLRVLYRPSATDRVSAEAGMLTSKVLACAVAKGFDIGYHHILISEEDRPKTAFWGRGSW
jgi:hypothetical protein